MFAKLAARYKTTNPLDSGKSQALSSPSVSFDYKTLLTEFYQKYNPTKMGEVPKRLEQYKV